MNCIEMSCRYFLLSDFDFCLWFVFFEKNYIIIKHDQYFFTAWSSVSGCFVSVSLLCTDTIFFATSIVDWMQSIPKWIERCWMFFLLVPISGHRKETKFILLFENGSFRQFFSPIFSHHKNICRCWIGI